VRIKILPLLIFFAFALVVAKVFDLAVDKGAKNNNLTLSTSMKAQAESKPAAEKHDAAEAPKEDAPKEGAPKEGAAKEGEAPPTDEKQHSDAPQENPPKSVEITDQAPMEKALLENLSKRRKELDDWANTISMKESVLNATEKKINSKMEEMKKLQTEITSLLEQYKAKEDEKNKKLVKIYESMKPADAAKILENMDIVILMQITGGMKEDNAAKIFAKMDPNKAKDLTTKLAEQRTLGSHPAK
jgi:flagellar motility protein MotE (MotC chaperone)